MVSTGVGDADKLGREDMITRRQLPVVEVFGPTIQGEGPMAGAVSHFVRFGGCDFRCSWCDSAPAVLPETVRLAKRYNESDILIMVKELPLAPWVTITGGNPALHDIGWLVYMLRLDGYQVAVETQGSKWKDWLSQVDQLTVSPKPPSSLMATPEAWFDLRTFLANAERAGIVPTLKVPIFDRRDFDWATNLHHASPTRPLYLSIVTSMGGLHGNFNGGKIDTYEDLLERYHQVVEWTLHEPSMKDVRVIPQLHVLIWGHERGH